MLEAYGLSDPGCVRSNNEDYFINDSSNGIFILADGMGGANAGELASRLSAETLYEFLVSRIPMTESDDLRDGFVQANEVVRLAAESQQNLKGMGTTLVAARLIRTGELQLASVGDSRAYHLTRGGWSQLTCDQTWVQEIGIPLGLTEDALRDHPMRHVLMMAIGVTDQVRVRIQNVPVQPGDQILLCSDGLHGVVEEKKLENALQLEISLPDKALSYRRR